MTGCCFFLFPNKIMRKEKKSSTLLPGREGMPGMTWAGCGEEASPWLLLLHWELICMLNVLSRACPKNLWVPISVAAAGPISIKHAICRQKWGSVTASFFLWSSYVQKKAGQKTNYFSFNGFLMLRVYRITEAKSVKIPCTETITSLWSIFSYHLIQRCCRPVYIFRATAPFPSHKSHFILLRCR